MFSVHPAFICFRIRGKTSKFEYLESLVEMIGIRFQEVSKKLKQFERLVGLMEIGHTRTNTTKGKIPEIFSGALIEYAVILFKKQKEQKEPKKEVEAHRSSGDYLIIIILPYFYETVPKITRFDCFQTLCKLG